MQREFFSGQINAEVLDTMQLLAELYTVSQKPTQAIALYSEMLTA